MKKIIVIFFVLALFHSCQTEESKISMPADGQLTPNSPLSDLVFRVAQYPTAVDNILDASSCTGIGLPATVVANGQQVTITTTDDYQTVADILNASPTDVDSVSFIFPIVVITADHIAQTVNSQQEFVAILDGCISNPAFEEIQCIDFNYPIAFNTYNTATQVANLVTIMNDTELYGFLSATFAQQIVSIVYPISLTRSNNQSVVVNDNDELEAAISASIDDCTIVVPPTDPLAELLISGSWYVSYYYHNEDETSQFAAYDFVFLDNGTISASDGSQTFIGTWNSYDEGTQQMLDIDFSDSELGDLDDDWRLIDFDANNVRLRQDGGGDDPDRLYFTRN